MRPETETPETADGRAVLVRQGNGGKAGGPLNALDAATAGAADGVKLAINVGAMMIAFLGLIALANILLGAAGGLTDAAVRSWGYRLTDPAWSMEKGLAWAFRPVAWALGVPAADRAAVAELLGTKTVLNEFIAYARLADPARADMAALSPRGRMIAVYALCGFANFSSVGVQLGALSFLAPDRRGAVAKLALRAMVAGTLAAFMTACVAGILADPTARMIVLDDPAAELPAPAEGDLDATEAAGDSL